MLDNESGVLGSIRDIPEDARTAAQSFIQLNEEKITNILVPILSAREVAEKVPELMPEAEDFFIQRNVIRERDKTQALTAELVGYWNRMQVKDNPQERQGE